jgi:hypothetical protein
MPAAELDFDHQFDFETDQPRATKPDADSDSPTLRRYHQQLWSKPLRSGHMFTLKAPTTRREGYLTYRDASGHQHGSAATRSPAPTRAGCDRRLWWTRSQP